jgi:TolA-binding protein
MTRWAHMGVLSACFALAIGCEQRTEVQRQTRELEEAQKNVARQTEELESQLETARSDVARLEQKVALARQGLTDDVLENQRELTEALKAQEQNVQKEVGQAKREVEIHTRDSEAALKQLGQTAAPVAEAPPPVELAAPVPVPLENPEPSDLVPVKGGPDPGPEGSVELQPGTPEPVAPPAALAPNDPPASAVTPQVVPDAIPSSDAPPSATPPSPSPPATGTAPVSPAPR